MEENIAYYELDLMGWLRSYWKVTEKGMIYDDRKDCRGNGKGL